MTVLPIPIASDPMRRFVVWAVAQLGFAMTWEGDVCRLTIPEESGQAFCGRRRLRIRFAQGGSPATDGASDPAEIAVDGPWFEWLVERLRVAGREQPGGVVHAEPRCPALSVHQVAQRLFAAYRVDGGSLHLGGCTLEDRPLVRVTYRDGPVGTEHAGPIRHVFVDATGELIAREAVAALHLDELAPFPAEKTRHVPADALDRLVAIGRRRAAACLGPVTADPAAEPVATTLVWCKYAEGKLRFTVGDQTSELPFRGWAGTLLAPPFVCSQTGASGYHLAATDDGLITVADQIAVCEESDQRVLARDLVVCSATGRRVLDTLTESCPITGRAVLPASMVVCQTCRQRVSPATIQLGVCRACRTAARVARDDPRVARILRAYPTLASWHAWRLAETAATYIVRAKRRWSGLLLVLDKSSLQPLHIARRNRFSREWHPQSPDRYVRQNVVEPDKPAKATVWRR